MRLISRSGLETRIKCPRKFYYENLYAGSGLTEALMPLELALGLAFHSGQEKNVLGLVEEAVVAGRARWQEESAGHPATTVEEGGALVEGLLRAWHRVRYTEFASEWEVVSVEQEAVLPLLPGSVGLYYRTDLTARSKLNGRLYVWNWKTAGSLWDWQTKWEFQPETITEALAVEQAAGEPVAGTIMEGVLKGARKLDKTLGRETWNSPLIWGYRGSYSGPWLPKVSKEERSAYERVPIWKEGPFDASLTAWIDWLPFDEVERGFDRARVRRPPAAKVAEWIAGIVREETDVEHVLAVGSEEDKLLFFNKQPSHFACSRCWAQEVCWGEDSVAAKLQRGELRPKSGSPRAAMEREMS